MSEIPEFHRTYTGKKLDQLSLRDYFAAHVMPGLLASKYDEDCIDADDTEFEVAKYAYRLADAMLAARAHVRPTESPSEPAGHGEAI